MATTYYLTTKTSDLSGGANWTVQLEEATPSTQTLTSTIANNAVDETDLAITPSGDPGADGTSGNYTVVCEIDLGDANVSLDVGVARVNSSGTVQGSVVLSDGGNQTASAGTLTYNFTAPSLGTWATGDRLRVEFRHDNASEHGGTETVRHDIGSAGSTVEAPWSTALTVSPTSLSAGATIGSPTTASEHTASPTSLDASATIGAPTTAVEYVATVTAHDASATVGSPTTASEHTASPTSLSAGPTIGSPTASESVTASPASLDASAAFGTASTSSEHTASATSLDASAAFGAATTSSEHTASATALDASATIGAPAILEQITATALNASATFGSPIVGAVASPSALDASATIGAPAILEQITATALNASAAFGSPTAASEHTASATALDASATVGAPATSVEYVASATALDASAAFGSPSLAEQIGATALDASATIGSPSVAVSTTPEVNQFTATASVAVRSLKASVESFAATASVAVRSLKASVATFAATASVAVRSLRGSLVAVESNIGRGSDPAFVGEDIDIVFTVTGVDVTGWTIECDFGTAPVSGSVVLTDAAGGEATVSLTAANTTALGVGSHDYKLRRTDSGSNTVLAFGQLRLQA